MKKIITTMIAGLLLLQFNGCTESNTDNIHTAKKDAYRQWADSRIKLYMELAEKNYKTGELDLAREKLVEVVKLDDKNENARLMLAKICIEQGDYKPALQQIEYIIQKNHTSADAFYLQGVIFEKQNKLKNALASYSQAYQLVPQSIEPIMAAAEVMVGLNRTDEALMLLEKHIKPTGDQPGAYELAGRIAMQLKQYRKASTYFQRACDRDFKNKRYPELLARAYMMSDRYDLAIRTLKRIIEKRDRAEQKAWMYIMLGDCQMAIRHNHDAFASFRQATQMDRGSIDAWSCLSKAALVIGRNDDALKASIEALKRSPNDLEANILCCYAMLKTKRVPQAQRRLEMLEKLYPDNEQITCLLGRAHMLQGRHDQARKCFARAMKKNPQHQASMMLLAHAR